MTILGLVSRLSPIGAFFITNFGFAVSAYLLVMAMARPTPNPLNALSSVIAMIFFLGWPTIVALTLRKNAAHLGVNSKKLVLSVFVGALVAHGVLVQLLWAQPSSDESFTALATVTWILGFIGPLYLMGVASSSLAGFDKTRSATIETWIGTFILFACLPIGVIFIQRRLRKLIA